MLLGTAGSVLAEAPPNKPDRATATVAMHEPEVHLPALRRAIEDLTRTFGDQYLNSVRYLTKLTALESAATQRDIRSEFINLQREALLANPLLDFPYVLLVKRPARSPALGLPQNWESNCSLPRGGYDDELCVWSLKDKAAAPRTLFKPGGKFVGDVDLHWNGDRVLFSMPGTNGRWQVFELELGRINVRQLTGEQPDVDSYDACYLPNGRIAFTSTAMFVGVPCVNGSAHVATLYVMDADGRNIRQLGFDQENNWCPTVMNDGRLLYARWEYTDTPHSNSRLLFTMNPDGTSQSAYLGSGSYWPKAFFYARPIPNHPTKIVAVIGGHHDTPRMGELVVFDPQRGQREGEPAVQRIPGFGKKVEPLIRDGLTLGSWPKFLHPWPLSEKYFLVACKPSPRAPWGLYLADIFDNMLPLKQLPDYALLEPIPLRRTARPPVLPDRVNPTLTDALVVLQDIYSGAGLRGVPRGTVKSLRLFTYHSAYQGMGGLLGVAGMDGPWDIKRVLGTVPVEADGSAYFRAPSGVALFFQALDGQGRAVQTMRSATHVQPGQTLSCTGCHDLRKQTPPPSAPLLASLREPSKITVGPEGSWTMRFDRLIQPVLDAQCVRCHQPGSGDAQSAEFDLTPARAYYSLTRSGRPSLQELVLSAYRDGVSTEGRNPALRSAIFRLLTHPAVHHGVKLERANLDRFRTWMDTNAQRIGTLSPEQEQEL